MNLKYEISDFMTLDEFEKYVNDNFNEKKYFLLIMKHGKFEELIPCHIYTFKDLQLIPINDESSDYPTIFNINEMKRAMIYEFGNGIEYYIALKENEKVIKGKYLKET